MSDSNHLKEQTILKSQRGSYIINSKLGEGGFGITYKAYAVIEGAFKSLSSNIPVAIKEFFISDYSYRESDGSIHTKGMSHEQYLKYKKKFEREAHSLHQYDHPNIVKVYDIFEAKNTVYIVMQFIQGETFDKFLNSQSNNRISESKIEKYIIQICGALSTIHDKNELHLDIKPDNIMITNTDNAVLIDFGIAKQIDSGQKDVEKTSIAFTESYSPPEQLASSSNSRLGRYSDIYALGAVMYRALTGRPPANVAERSIKKQEEPVAIEKSISLKTNNIIIKAMQMLPIDRYQTISDFMQDYLDNISQSNNNELIESLNAKLKFHDKYCELRKHIYESIAKGKTIETKQNEFFINELETINITTIKQIREIKDDLINKSSKFEEHKQKLKDFETQIKADEYVTKIVSLSNRQASNTKKQQIKTYHYIADLFNTDFHSLLFSHN